MTSLAQQARTIGHRARTVPARHRSAARRRRSAFPGIAAHKLLRILVASYFIGISLNLAPGVDPARLFLPILPSEQAEQVGAAIVFALSWLILAGMWLRPAVLLLALIVFWSSFLENVLDTGSIAAGDFWRDLTLIGALMLTYLRLGPEAARMGGLLRFTPKVRRLGRGAPIAPRRVLPQTAKAGAQSRAATTGGPTGRETPAARAPRRRAAAPMALDDVQNIFLDPPELALR